MTNSPEINAHKVLQEYRMQSLKDFNIDDILDGERLIVEEDNLKNYLGRISFSGDHGLITVDNKIREGGQKRFTLAHEMGHYFNEREIRTKAFYKCTEFDIYSFKSNKRYEVDANEFAAELLMHKPWFGEYIKKRKINFDLIKQIADDFSVSLTAAAIRYSNIGKYPVAVIFTKDGKKAWSSINDYFPFKWIPQGYKVRKESAAYDFFDGKEMQTCDDLVPAEVWFADDRKCRKDVYIYEQNVAMKNYNSVLTLLWESEFR